MNKMHAQNLKHWLQQQRSLHLTLIYTFLGWAGDFQTALFSSRHTCEYYIRERDNKNSEQNVLRHSHLHGLWRASPVATVQTRGCLSKYVCALVCLLRCYCHMNGKAAAMFNFTSWKHLHISKKTHWHLGLDN